MIAARPSTTGLTLAQLLNGYANSLPAGDLEIEGIALDSRVIEPGWLFLACQGHRGHGLAHLADALARGAAAVAWEPVGFPAGAWSSTSEAEIS